MKLSEMSKDIQEIIKTFGDFELDSTSINTNYSDIKVENINKFYITVDGENKTACINLLSV